MDEQVATYLPVDPKRIEAAAKAMNRSEWKSMNEDARKAKCWEVSVAVQAYLDSFREPSNG